MMMKNDYDYDDDVHAAADDDGDDDDDDDDGWEGGAILYWALQQPMQCLTGYNPIQHIICNTTSVTP